VKNLYGCIPGYQKAALHKTVPRPREFGLLLKAIADEVKPMLTIADGIVAMEGDGPSSGTPVPLGILVASEDPFALDMRLCDFLRIPRKSVPYLRPLPSEPSLRDGGGFCPSPLIAELPPEWKALQPSRFKLPSTFKTRMIPRWAARLISPLLWVRPVFDGALCVRCGRCVKACPVHILSLADSQRGASLPTCGQHELVNRKSGDLRHVCPTLSAPSKCIGCCCCHELCPVKAVHMKQSPLLRLARTFKGL